MRVVNIAGMSLKKQASRGGQHHRNGGQHHQNRWSRWIRIYTTDLGIKFSFPTLTPLIQAYGQNSRFGEWSIKKHENPLVGDQILAQILLTEKGLPSLKFKSLVSVTIKKFEVFKSQRESDWINLGCDLI